MTWDCGLRSVQPRHAALASSEPKSTPDLREAPRALCAAAAAADGTAADEEKEEERGKEEEGREREGERGEWEGERGERKREERGQARDLRLECAGAAE